MKPMDQARQKNKNRLDKCQTPNLAWKWWLLSLRPPTKALKGTENKLARRLPVTSCSCCCDMRTLSSSRPWHFACNADRSSICFCIAASLSALRADSSCSRAAILFFCSEHSCSSCLRCMERERHCSSGTGQKRDDWVFFCFKLSWSIPHWGGAEIKVRIQSYQSFSLLSLE